MASTSNVASDDYYKVLGADRQCDEAALKKAYRRAAVKWHPDKWSSKSQAEQKAAEENFKRVAEAYDALSGPAEAGGLRPLRQGWLQKRRPGRLRRAARRPRGAVPPVLWGGHGRPGMAFGGVPMGGMHFGGGPGMAFYVNGVPVGGRRRGGAPPQPMEMPQIEVPPFVEALIKTVPPPFACCRRPGLRDARDAARWRLDAIFGAGHVSAILGPQLRYLKTAGAPDAGARRHESLATAFL